MRAWTDPGFAALAIDYQGNMPLQDCPVDTSKYVEIPGFSAPKNIAFADAEKPNGDQWMCWATSAVILHGASVVSAKLVGTMDTLLNDGTAWNARSLSSLDRIESELPADWEFCFVSETDNKGLVASTTLFESERE